MQFCFRCGEPVIKEENHENIMFCSTQCMDKHYLTKCSKGEMSFLDVPSETRNREMKRKLYKCVAKTCPICGTIFYTGSVFNDHTRKYCSDRCTKIAIKHNAEKNWWKTLGWMSPNWRGGVNNGIYCHKFNADLKRRVRAFFGNKCFLCGKPQEECGRLLSVHHVNYNKNACCDSSRVLLVPLCEGCHGKTNQDRERWEDYFETILREEYNYKCYYTKDEYNNLSSQEIPA